LNSGLPITPVVLSYNEEPNLARTLDALRWAGRVVVVDSGSTDATERIARSFSNVAFFVRKFDDFGGQWTFAFQQTGITTTFILALDADMAMTPEFRDEIEREFLPGGCDGGLVPIAWCYFGRPLRGSFCPPQLRLFKGELVKARQVGHAHEFQVEGELHRFRAGVWHEDRKSVERWLQSQASYSRMEAERLHQNQRLRARDRLRRSGWMPALAMILAYLRAGGPLGGQRALRYAWERATYESLLAIRVLDRRLAAEEEKQKQR
jgi:glycosyltransferase involved in cell wall biosynthesis